MTLQKEQTLVSGATARNPSAARLERAMGYACPDNVGGHCDPAYAGVGNQVYWSAWQWKRYGNPAGTSNYFTWFNPGGVRQIQYNVPTSCGTKSVSVQNKATAALYYYTPYTPNTAALNNLYGTGDSCSAYGNRNFWRMYTDWFGSPTASAKPIGRLDSVQDAGDAVAVRGWAIDPTTTAATRVHVFVDSSGAGYTANASRPDVGKAYPGSGNSHGYDLTIAATPGKHQVCASAISVDGTKNQSLGCKSVTVTKASPDGRVDSVTTVVGGVAVRGWTYDPNQPKTALTVKVSVGGKVTTIPANRTRADVGKAYPAAGAVHGYEATVPAVSGNAKVCVTAVNVGAGHDAQLGTCTTVRAVASAPDGRVDQVAPRVRRRLGPRMGDRRRHREADQRRRLRRRRRQALPCGRRALGHRRGLPGVRRSPRLPGDRGGEAGTAPGLRLRDQHGCRLRQHDARLPDRAGRQPAGRASRLRHPRRGRRDGERLGVRPRHRCRSDRAPGHRRQGHHRCEDGRRAS
ncbi:hypothetical protein [Curtobacterium sp. MCPF17_052]|uniref:hypothetical protein n=1 Tax=Curtobacterium sp. MCPF17_052 TaxID=2175655 RepID=UPI0024DFA97E|nr:hypothetical protein [Curtobacterium sp. MCPF17_052]WIB13007.1 hypothetical protein DEJ36_03160 [Curtobacterium sp. MCPF17_052]